MNDVIYPVTGLHHVSAIASDPQRNLDFYAGVMGMRLVKKSVNQDDPGTYHLFYADGAGTPGSDLTFFPWPHLRAGRQGRGLATEVDLAVPVGALGFWAERLARYGIAADPVEIRFGERTLPFRDPDGLPVALVETDSEREFIPWSGSPIAVERQVRRLHAVRLDVADGPATSAFLRNTLGYSVLAEEAGWLRFVAPGSDAEGGGESGRVLDVRADPASPRGLQGAGTVHHVAFRVADQEALDVARGRVSRAGLGPTPVIDRFWFRSVYFQEPGRVLFELATDGPGFTVDEELGTLGEALVLPPWLESQRKAIEERLPRLGPTRPAASFAEDDS